MFIIQILLYFYIIQVNIARNCYCYEYLRQDRCLDQPGCTFNDQADICQDIKCELRYEEECSHYGGAYKCIYNEYTNLCTELTTCSDLSNPNITKSTTFDECYEKECYWNYQTETCSDEQLSCSDYPVSECNNAFEFHDNKLTRCIINGNNGDQCDRFERCEDIDYKESCDPEYCIYEDDDEQCKTKECEDYPVDECPTMNLLSQQKCIPHNNLCSAYTCSDYTTAIKCESQPHCFWGTTTFVCREKDCSLAIRATQCFAFYSDYGVYSCAWDGIGCNKCGQSTGVLLQLLYIMPIFLFI